MMKPVLFKLLLTLAFIATGAAFAQAEINTSGVLGFQAWKSTRVSEARSTLDKVTAELQAANAAVAPGAAKLPAKPARGDQKLQQAQFNVEIAQELTIGDYFTLYISQLKDRSSLVDAAKKLSVEETADLMAAYQKAISATSSGSDVALPLLASPSTQVKPTRFRD